MKKAPLLVLALSVTSFSLQASSLSETPNVEEKLSSIFNTKSDSLERFKKIKKTLKGPDDFSEELADLQPKSFIKLGALFHRKILDEKILSLSQAMREEKSKVGRSVSID